MGAALDADHNAAHGRTSQANISSPGSRVRVLVISTHEELEIALTEPAYYEKQSEGTAGLVTFLGGAIVFFFSVGAIIGAMITMYAAVSHRRREVGTLRALGFSRSTILFSFLLEAVLLSLLGGLMGALASLGMGFVHFSMMNFNSWSEITFSFDPAQEIIIGALLVGGFMGILGGLFPAVQAARTSPVEAMRD